MPSNQHHAEALNNVLTCSYSTAYEPVYDAVYGITFIFSDENEEVIEGQRKLPFA